jgi:PAS domain S-box-containing protein
MRRTLTDASNRALMAAAAQAAGSIDAFITAGLDSVRVEAQLPELGAFLAPPAAARRERGASYQRTMASLNALSRKSQLFISSYGLLDRAGRNLIDTYAGRVGDDESQADYFRLATGDGLPHVSSVLVAARTPLDTGLFFSCTVRDAEQHPAGVLRVRYHAAVLQELIVRSARRAGAGSLAMLFDENLVFLAHSSQPELILTSAVDLEDKVVAALQQARRLPGRKAAPAVGLGDLERGLSRLATQPYFTFTPISVGQDATFSAAGTPLATRPWHVVLAKPRGAFLAPVNVQMRQTILLAVVLCCAVLAAALMIAGVLARPIVHLRAVAGRVAEGDLDVSARVRSQDEIGELGSTFNRMTGELRQLIDGMRRGEEALRESENRFRRFFELGLVGMVISSGDEEWIDVNDRLCEILGLSRAALTSTPWVKLVHPEDREAFATQLRSLISGELGGLSMDLRLLRRDGQTVYSTVSVTCVRSDPHVVEYVIGLVQDITRRKLAEDEKRSLEERLARSRKMEALGLLAGGVAHDLNNVLSGIVGYPDLMLMDLPADSPLRKPILTMQESGRRSAAIVQDLLALSRRGVTSSVLLGLNDDIVADYLRSPEHAQLRLHHPDVRIDTELAPTVLSIRGSAVHLRKTVTNLVSNAAEAQPHGGRILIATENRYVDRPFKGYQEIQEGEYVVLRVEDHGIGISAENLDRIFEPFYSKKVMGRSGTGLGMAVVWGAVQDHDGYIDVRSAEGEGTSFELYFPAVRGETAKREGPLPVDEYMGEGQTVLVVDDVENQREVAAGMLARLGYEVTTVTSGEEAVDQLSNSAVDLLVLDMIMEPGIDGLETYRRIVAQHPGQKAVIASGFSDNEQVKEAQRLGAGKYVQKPYTLEQLGLAVKAELGDP